MTDDNQQFDKLFTGLKALAESSFPKRCENCGRSFDSAEQFLSETQDISAYVNNDHPSSVEDGINIIEVFRNCPCGSTLMDFFSERRDCSDAGVKRREIFEGLLHFLTEDGLEKYNARTELLKVVRGEKSEVLSKIRP